MATKLGLNAQETASFLTEVTNALQTDQTSKSVRISFASQAEVNQKLPLQISPTPDHVNRIHVLLTPTDGNTPSIEPSITPVNRSGFSIVELGARLTH